MVKLDKIYTRGGDSGLTSLGDGKRVKKNSLRIRAYGEIDEVNSILGIVVCYCNEFLKKIILKIQNDLFDVGADLCIPSLNEKKIILNEQNILFLEKELDKINDKLKHYVFTDVCHTKVVKNVHGDSGGVRGAAWLS